MIQWFKDGDHPAVEVEKIDRRGSTNFICNVCGFDNWSHGYVSGKGSWQTVCPGDYIVRDGKKILVLKFKDVM